MALKLNTVDLENVTLTYTEPKLNDDGSCPIFKEPGKVYDLSVFATNEHELKTLRAFVAQLKAITRHIQNNTAVEWFGIYLHINQTLVKFAYHGEMSRAEFPVSEAYKSRSTNVTVFLDKRVAHIPDVSKFDGAYYRCDAKVKSELCVPLVIDGKAVGIFDAEAHTPRFFEPFISYFTKEVRKELEYFLADQPARLFLNY